MPLTGTLLHYRILGSIGKGGMGEVYAAEDTRLHRKVALKILPEIVARDPERRQRFEREAQAIAALNHPNIVTIYSVEEAGGMPFLAMELVEGTPLSDLIPASGMAPERLLRIAVAVADALAAAQQRGITHRDLKPANVMITPDGRVKVLDFGLAKLKEAGSEDAAGDLTRIATDSLTGEGKIIGTVAYMSPEQAEGKPVDPRSDIFSLGVLIHEMATGDRPFKGDTNVSIISSILKDTPSSITDLNPKLPPDLTRIARRCLAKDPARRFQSAADLRSELEEIALGVTAASGITARPPAGKTGRSNFGWIAIAAGGLAIAALSLFIVTRTTRSRVTSTAQPFLIDHFSRLTTTGTVSLAALSRDGRYVVHVKQEDGNPSLWTRQTATTSDVRIVPPQTVVYDGLAFSPDGNFVYYNTYPKPGGGMATLYKLPVLGGAPATVVEDIDSAVTFSPDGSRMAFLRGVVEKGTNAIIVANIDGGDARPLASLKLPERFQNETASWSPDGKTVLATGNRANATIGVFAVGVPTGAIKSIGADWAYLRNVQWMPDGRSFIVDAVDLSGTNTTPQLWQVAYPAGTRTHVTNDLNSYFGVSISGDGRLIATVQGETVAGISTLTEGATEWKQVTTPSTRGDGVAGLAILPDGRIVYGTSGNGLPQLWIMNADGSGQRQIENVPIAATNPSASPDGRWIYFQGYSKAGLCIYRIAPDGGGLQQITHGGDEAGPVVSPDGRTIYLTLSRSGQPHPAKVAADGGDPVQFSDGYLRVSQVSPDGTKLVGQSWDFQHRRPSVGVLAIDGTGAVQLVPDVAVGARMRPDGSFVYSDRLREPMEILIKPAGGGPTRRLGPALAGTPFWGTATPDARTLVVSHGRQTTDVVLITAAAPKPS